MRSLTFACHTAYLDDETGSGLLLRPLPPLDVPDPVATGTLHAVDWDAAVSNLHALGWEPSEDEHGDLIPEGYTADGREVVGLFSWEPTCEGGISEQAAAFAALRLAAGARAHAD